MKKQDGKPETIIELARQEFDVHDMRLLTATSLPDVALPLKRLSRDRTIDREERQRIKLFILTNNLKRFL